MDEIKIGAIYKIKQRKNLLSFQYGLRYKVTGIENGKLVVFEVIGENFKAEYKYSPKKFLKLLEEVK